jgi:hypothetical protein
MRCFARFYAVLLCVLAGSAGVSAANDAFPTQQVWMLLDDGGALLNFQRTGIEVQVSELWGRYGVELAWHDHLPSPGEWGGRVLVVRVSDELMARQGGKGADPQTLGVVMFLPAHDVFGRTIFVAPTATRRLLSRPGVLTDRMIVDRVLARALARVVAHEIGHILLDMPGHAVEGLMKPRFEAGDLVNDTIEHLQLGPEELLRLPRPAVAAADER